MIIVEEDSTEATQRTNLLGTAADLTGVYALQGADPIPKVLCVGHDVATDRTGGNANTLASGLVEVAGNVRGIAVLDGPNDTQAAAITFAGDFDSARAYLVDPGVNDRRRRSACISIGCGSDFGQRLLAFTFQPCPERCGRDPTEDRFPTRQLSDKGAGSER